VPAEAPASAGPGPQARWGVRTAAQTNPTQNQGGSFVLRAARAPAREPRAGPVDADTLAHTVTLHAGQAFLSVIFVFFVVGLVSWMQRDPGTTTLSGGYRRVRPRVSGIQIQATAARTKAAAAVANAAGKPCESASVPTVQGAAALAILPRL
jgi:hypothetical protein